MKRFANGGREFWRERLAANKERDDGHGDGEAQVLRSEAQELRPHRRYAVQALRVEPEVRYSSSATSSSTRPSCGR